MAAAAQAVAAQYPGGTSPSPEDQASSVSTKLAHRRQQIGDIVDDDLDVESSPTSTRLVVVSARLEDVLVRKASTPSAKSGGVGQLGHRLQLVGHAVLEGQPPPSVTVRRMAARAAGDLAASSRP